MPDRDERSAESLNNRAEVRARGARALKNGGDALRLFLALVLLAAMLTSVPVTKAQQQEDGSADSVLSVAFQNLEPSAEALAGAGVAISRLDTRRVSVKGLDAGVYDLVLQDDGKGGFRVHAVELGTGQVYQDIATPTLTDTATGKVLSVALNGEAGGDLRAAPICITVSTTIIIYGIPVTVQVTVCFELSR